MKNLEERNEIKIRLSVRGDLLRKAEVLARKGGWHDAVQFIEGLLNTGIDGLLADRLGQMERAYARFRTHTMGQEVIDNGDRERNEVPVRGGADSG